MSNQMVKLLKTQFSVFGPSDLPMSEIVVRYLSISRLGILSNLIKLPFEQVVDVKPFIRHFFFIQKEGSESLNESSLSHEIDENAFRIAEGKIASLSHSDLIHYLKSVACFIKRRPGSYYSIIFALVPSLYQTSSYVLSMQCCSIGYIPI